MKKYLMSCVVFLLLSSLALAGPVIDGYKAIKFGMTADQARAALMEVTGAKANELTELDDNGYYIIARWKLLNRDCVVQASMPSKDGTVATVTISFREKHTNRDDFKGDYEAIQSALESKYGEPDYHVYQPPKNKHSSFGIALITGKAMIGDDWYYGKNSRYKVQHRLTGDNYRASHRVTFFDMQAFRAWHEGVEADAF